MAMPPLSDSRREPAEPPSEVQVTVFRSPSELHLNGWLARHRSTISLLVAAIVVGGVAFGISASPGGRAVSAGVADPGPAGVAAAYGYPPACLRVRISAVDPEFARADFARGSCPLQIAFPTALFHRFGSEWHPMYYAIYFPCRLPLLPAAVQRELIACG